MTPTNENEPVGEFTPASAEELTQTEGGAMMADPTPEIGVPVIFPLRFFFW